MAVPAPLRMDIINNLRLIKLKPSTQLKKEAIDTYIHISGPPIVIARTDGDLKTLIHELEMIKVQPDYLEVQD